MFPAAQLDEVVAAARNARIGLHLDGARLPIAAAARGMSMASFAAPYDTVYMSLWKMLGLPFGAVLAGPLALLDGIERDRRRLGGALPQFWPIAALVLAELDRLEADWMKTFEWRSALERALSNAGMATRSVGVETTNTFWLVPRKPATDFKMACKEAGVALADVAGDAILLRANPTALDIDPTDLARKLVTASV
jgi:threonine aldolase